MCQEYIRKEYEHAAGDDGIGAGLADIEAAALHEIAVIGGDAADDECEDDALDDARPHVPGVEVVQQAYGQVVGGNDACNGCGVCSHKAKDDAEDDEEGYHRHHAYHLGQDEEGGGVDAHDFEGIYLLRHTHGAYLGSDVRPYLAGQDETHDAGRELEQHDFARGVAGGEGGHPGALDVELDLDADDCTDEEADEQHDADGIDTEGAHLTDILPHEHTPTLGDAQHPSHELQVSAKGGQPIH